LKSPPQRAAKEGVAIRRLPRREAAAMTGRSMGKGRFVKGGLAGRSCLLARHQRLFERGIAIDINPG
jgi:hypothetical protein